MLVAFNQGATECFVYFLIFSVLVKVFIVWGVRCFLGKGQAVS